MTTTLLEVPPSRDAPRLRLSCNGELVKLVRDRLEVMSFDMAGRPLSVALEGSVYRRGLDGTILKIDRVGNDDTHFCDVRTLSPEQRRALLAKLHQRLHEARRVLGESFAPLGPAVAIDLEQDAAVFRGLYHGVGILPPDCYRGLVLNLTEGCSYNKCSFCNFYKDRGYRVRPTAQFEDHIGEVVEAFGAALSYRRGVFLGEANAASLPFEHLAPALESIRKTFPARLADREGNPRHPQGFEHVSAFLDTFTQPGRPTSEWAELKELGLRSVYLGIESGSLDVLRLLRKPGSPRFAAQMVHRLKAAGIAANVIIMTGVGGHEMARDHVDATAALLNSLPLTRQDRVYFSELRVHPDSHYARTAQERGIATMTRIECREQTRLLRGLLDFPSPPAGPVLSLYDVRQFVY